VNVRVATVTSALDECWARPSAVVRECDGHRAQLTTFYTDLDADQLAIWQRWFRQYREMDLGRRVPQSLRYCIRQPESTWSGREMRCIRHFRRGLAQSRRIELRGLDRNMTYEFTITPSS